MQISLRVKDLELTQDAKERLEEKFKGVEKLLGRDADMALLELDIEPAPAEGRSSAPYRLVANVKVDGHVYHGEAVKPSPESAADRVRAELDAEIRRVRGKGKNFIRRGGAAVKDFLRFGR
jgi:ribosome-associated translation inhibitor RaiA